MPSLLETHKITTQNSSFSKEILAFESTYYKSGKNYFISLNLGNKKDVNGFQSYLLDNLSINSPSINSNVNHFKLTNNSLYQIGEFSFYIKKWRIKPFYKLSYIKQDFNDSLANNQLKNNRFIFEPSLNLYCKINNQSKFNFSLESSKDLVSVQHLFSNFVLFNHRAFLKNIPSLQVQNNTLFNAKYDFNDFFNHFEYNLNLTYQITNGVYLTNSSIDENFSYTEYFFIPKNSISKNVSIEVTKYVPFLETTFKYSSNYSMNNYHNIINQSEIRDNKSNQFSNKLFWKTGFDIPLNFENNFTFMQFKTQSKSDKNHTFSTHSIQNKFKIYYLPNEIIKVNLIASYFLPDVQNKKSDYLFLDTSFQYKPKNKNWYFGIEAKNLLNEKNFESVQTNDFSTSLYRSNLLLTHVLMNFSWDF